MSNKVLIEFVADTTSLDAANSSFEKLGATEKKVLQDMNTNLAKNTNEQKTNTESIDKTTKSVQDLAKATEQAEKAAIGSFGKSIVDNANKGTQATKEAIDSTDKLALGFNKVGQIIAEVGGENVFATLISGFANVKDEVEQLKLSVDLAKLALTFTENEEEINLITEAIKGAEAELKNFGEVGKKSSLKADLRKSREELAQMLVDGKITTAEIYRMAKAGGELKDAIGDAGDAISALASDTFPLDATIQSVQTLTAGFQVAQGAVALFGVENEELQEVLVKLNALMAITSGLQAIQNNIQKTSAQSLGLNILAQKAYNVVVGQSTGAMKLFRVALASTGIGLLVIELAALIANFDKVGAAIRNIFPFIDKFAEKFGGLKGFVNGIIGGIKESLEGVGKVLKNIVTFQFGKAIEEGKRLGGAFKQGFESEVAKTKILDKLEKAIEEAEIGILKARIKGNSEMKVLLAERNKIQLEADKLLLEKKDENDKEYLEKLVELADKNKQINSTLKSEADKAEALRKEQQQKALDNQRKAIQEEINVLEKRKIENKNNADELLKIEQDLVAKRAELSKVGITSKTAIELINAQSLNEQSELLDDFLKKAKEKALAEQLEIWTQSKLIDDNRIKKKLADINISYQEEYNLRMQLLENQKELDELEIEQSKDTEEIKIEKKKALNIQYENERLQIFKNSLDKELQYALAMYDAENSTHTRALEQIKGNEKLSFDERKQAIEELTDYKIGKIAIEKSALDEQLKKGLISNRDYVLKKKQLDNEEFQATEAKEEAITDLIEAEAEKRKKIMQQLKNAAFEIASTVISGAFELRKADAEQQLNDKLNQLNKEREIELANTSLTESQKAAIEKRYQREENELKKKAFEQKKKIDRNQAIINTAVAVTKAFADLGFIGGAIASAILATKLAFEIATIQKQKFPGFKGGTKNAPAGFKWVGEAGPELIYDKGGYPIITHKDSKLLAEMLDSYGIQHSITNGYNIPEIGMPKMPTVSSSVINNNAGQTTVVNNTTDFKMDYKKMAEAFAGEVAKNPSVSINVDKKGFTDFIQSKNSKTQNVNNYV